MSPYTEGQVELFTKGQFGGSATSLDDRAIFVPKDFIAGYPTRHERISNQIVTAQPHHTPVTTVARSALSKLGLLTQGNTVDTPEYGGEEGEGRITQGQCDRRYHDVLHGLIVDVVAGHVASDLVDDVVVV